MTTNLPQDVLRLIREYGTASYDEGVQEASGDQDDRTEARAQAKTAAAKDRLIAALTRLQG